jgi:hypothetical protein
VLIPGVEIALGNLQWIRRHSRIVTKRTLIRPGGWPRPRRSKNRTEGAPGPSPLGTEEPPNLNSQEEAHSLAVSIPKSAHPTPKLTQEISRRHFAYNFLLLAQTIPISLQ